ncbi:MAG: CHASE2 domain-containing protein [Rhodospirillales bacterium]
MTFGWRSFKDLASLTAFVVCAALICLALTRFVPLIGSAERWIEDLRISMLVPAEPPHPDIVVVAVTEDTLAQLPYRSPVDRDFVADLVAWLDAAGARIIVVDMLFDQPTEPAKDDRLRRTLLAAEAPVVVAWADRDEHLTERQAVFLRAYLEGIDRGFANLMTDPHQGTVRWIYPGRSDAGEWIPGLAGAVVAALGGTPPDRALALAFRPPPGPGAAPFRTFPAHAVKLLPPAWLAGKIVFIGPDLPHLDRHRIPRLGEGAGTGSDAPGVIIHAHAVAQLLDGRTAPAIDPRVELATVLAGALVAMLIAAMNLPVGIHTVIGVSTFVAVWLGGFALFAVGGPLIPLVSTSLAFALTFAFGNAVWRGRMRRQRDFIRGAFSHFTSPSVVDQLIADPSSLRPGGEKREITCLFTDIAGFTSWIEQSDPEAAVSTLNAYLDTMCRIVFDHGGTIDKIVGDALHVFFGVPLHQPDHPERAVRCALALDAFGADFAARQQAEGVRFGTTRIGVHTGPAVVGNFGGERFFDYTAHGDTVNTAARLEGANKFLGSRICASGSTVRGCRDIPFRPIAVVILYGKREPLEIYEPLSDGVLTRTDVAKYLAAYALMREHDPLAGDAFRALVDAHPDDPIARLHARRLAAGETGNVITFEGK